MYSFSIYEADPRIKTVKPVRGLERQEIPECRDQQYALRAAQAELDAYVDDVCARNGFSAGDVIYCVLYSPDGSTTLQREVSEEDLLDEDFDDDEDDDSDDESDGDDGWYEDTGDSIPFPWPDDLDED
jgi:hypothetical protein